MCFNICSLELPIECEEEALGDVVEDDFEAANNEPSNGNEGIDSSATGMCSWFLLRFVMHNF